MLTRHSSRREHWRYTEFADTLFKTYAAPGVGARLRTDPAARHGDRSSAYPGSWEKAWDLMFADEADRADPDRVKQRYKKLVARLGVEVGVTRMDGSDQ
jgi:hypothetical protein